MKSRSTPEEKKKEKIKHILTLRDYFIEFFVKEMYREAKTQRIDISELSTAEINNFIRSKMFRYRILFKIVHSEFPSKISSTPTTLRKIKCRFHKLQERVARHSFKKLPQ